MTVPLLGQVEARGMRLRPFAEDDLWLLRRFATEPYLIGLDWSGFRDAQAPARQFAADGFLGPDGGRLVVDAASAPGEESDSHHRAPGRDPSPPRKEIVAKRHIAGFVAWRSVSFVPLSPFWDLGISLLPEFRGRGLGWCAQALLAQYLFLHSPVQRLQAATHPENVAEQRSLERAGFQLEGVVRHGEFKVGYSGLTCSNVP